MFDKLSIKQLKDIIHDYTLTTNIKMSRTVDGKRKRYTKKEIANQLHEHLEITEDGEIIYKQHQPMKVRYDIIKPIKKEEKKSIKKKEEEQTDLIKMMNTFKDIEEEVKKLKVMSKKERPEQQAKIKKLTEKAQGYTKNDFVNQRLFNIKLKEVKIHLKK